MFISNIKPGKSFADIPIISVILFVVPPLVTLANERLSGTLVTLISNFPAGVSTVLEKLGI